MRISLITGLLFVLAGSLSAGEIYKWVDENGQVHYGSKPPADNAQRLQIRNQPAASDSGNAPSAEERLRQQQRFINALEEEQQSINAAKQKQQQQEEKQDRYCHQLRDRLARYQSSGLYDLDEQGNRRILNDAEHNAAIANVKAKLAAHCE